MRRGHPRIGGWRNENPRHYRPRNGGNTHFRSSRNYPPFDVPRFPPPAPRSSVHTYSHPGNNELRLKDNNQNSKYGNDRYNSYERHNRTHYNKYVQPIFPGGRSGDEIQSKMFKHQYDSTKMDYYHMNTMGDIDHRQLLPNREMHNTFQQNPISPWERDNKKYPSNENTARNTTWYDNNLGNDRNPVPGYTGHRPPSSDHYESNFTNPVSDIEKSNSYNRTADEAVDIIRQRLLNRHETNSTGNITTVQDNEEFQTSNLNRNDTHDIQEQQPTKRIQKQNPISSTGCAKIKKKIVNQLFKMDKEKIHKLMDNPSSSTKFEYAISSLITESQNSFNRHLRSVAEKSLCTANNSNFIETDNTIYEDTFMKQMQCILDPQDTVFLEDIKPIVMAELSKVLQLEDFEHIVTDENISYQNPENALNFHHHSNESIQYDDSDQQNLYASQSNNSQEDYLKSPSNDIHADYQQSHYTESKPLYERRMQGFNQSFDTTEAIELKQFHGTPNRNEIEPPQNLIESKLFDTNAIELSDDEDPFAELDKQYHVAVDHDFIDQDISSPKSERNNSENKSPEKTSQSIKKELSDELFKTFPKMSANTNHSENETSRPQKRVSNTKIKQELNQSVGPAPTTTPIKEPDKNQRRESQSNDISYKEDSDKSTNTSPEKRISLCNTRKRSIEQRPSHRKEKRKKVESTQPLDTSKKILNKNIIINVNDCASKSTENYDSPQSVFNLFFSKENSKPVSKDGKKSTCNKNHSDKSKKKDSDDRNVTSRKKLNSTSSNHSTSSKGDNSPNNNQTPSKSDGKTTLKPIDMFTKQPKKVNIHQAHRNTAPVPNKKIVCKIKTNSKSVSSKSVDKKHLAIQVDPKTQHQETQTINFKCTSSKLCQTNRKTFAVKAIQTDLIYEKSNSQSQSKDAFERMKEIDLEIQILLQEKFRLYSTIESKDSTNNSLQNLGMTVLNVNTFEESENNLPENMLSEDAIVENFTNIPVEDLEQLALESVQDHNVNKREKRTRNAKLSHKAVATANKNPIPYTPTLSRRNKKKASTPNISLIEQIISDDRPLEDIISLDDLEVTPVKTRNKTKRSKKVTRKSVISKTTISTKETSNLELKPCSVILIKQDLSKYLKIDYSLPQPETEELIIDFPLNELQQNNIIEETVVSDIQFDMLDVSEDIVIGDNWEVKSVEDKEIVEQMSVPINEEIILDNSQSLIEEAPPVVVGPGDECKVYDYAADENLRRDSVTVTGNADAVLAIECIENNFLAACLDGNVYYFSGDGQLITTLRGSNLAVTCLTIVKEKYGTTVYTGSLDSRIRYYDLETGLEKGLECNVLSPIQTMDRAWDTVFVGTRTGFVLQFECKNNMLIPVSTVKFSDQSILALRAMKEGPRKVLLVAARSENVTIKDAQTGLLLRTFVGPKMTVYTLLYEDGKVYCGTSSHQIHVFDYASGAPVGTHVGGKGAVCLRTAGGLVFAGCYDGCVYIFREGDGRALAQLRGPGLMLLSLAVVGTKIIAGYKDRSLYIWKIPVSILGEMIL